MKPMTTNEMRHADHEHKAREAERQFGVIRRVESGPQFVPSTHKVMLDAWVAEQPLYGTAYYDHPVPLVELIGQVIKIEIVYSPMGHIYLTGHVNEVPATPCLWVGSGDISARFPMDQMVEAEIFNRLLSFKVRLKLTT